MRKSSNKTQTTSSNIPTTTKGMTVVTTRATVTYPHILDGNMPRVQADRRFIYRDEVTDKLYTDTGYVLFPVKQDALTGSYICQAREASL